MRTVLIPLLFTNYKGNKANKIPLVALSAYYVMRNRLPYFNYITRIFLILRSRVAL